MPGKHGGFFKRLKAKEKRDGGRRKRGSSGLSKEDRTAKLNSKVDYFSAMKAKHKLDELAREEKEAYGEKMKKNKPRQYKRGPRPVKNAFSRFQTMIGLGKGGDGATPSRTHRDSPHTSPRQRDLLSEDPEESLDLEDGSDVEIAGRKRFRESLVLDDGGLPLDDSDDDAEDMSDAEGGVEKGLDGDDEGAIDCGKCGANIDTTDSRAMVCMTCQSTFCGKCFVRRQHNGHELLTMEELDERDMPENLPSGNDDDEAEDGNTLEGEDEEEEDDDDFGQEDDELQEEDEDKEDEVVVVEDDAQSETEDCAEERLRLLPNFDFGSAEAAKLKGVIPSTTDPWWQKYYADALGEPDMSTTAVLAPTPFTEDANFIISATSKAARHVKKVVEGSQPGGAALPNLHKLLRNSWRSYASRRDDAGATGESKDGSAEQDTLQRWMFGLFSQYVDVTFTSRSWGSERAVMEATVIHMANHVTKARAVVLAHDAILQERRRAKSTHEGKTAGKQQSDGVAADVEDEQEVDDSFRDRGFTQPRVLIMLPMRNIALRYVELLIEVMGFSKERCVKYDEFVRDFSELEEAKDPTFRRRPLDYRRLMDGNINDSFCVGISLRGGGRGGLKLYAPPMASDIIICSPLGLRQRLSKHGDLGASLSSIEMMIIDQAHVILMQSWEHLLRASEEVNKRPTDTTEGLADLTRVFSWMLKGETRRHRQTILVSDWDNAEFVSFMRDARSNSGAVHVTTKTHPGQLHLVRSAIRQHFIRLDVPENAEALESTLAQGKQAIQSTIFSTDVVRGLGTLGSGETKSQASSAVARHIVKDDFVFANFVQSIYPTKIQPLIERQVRTIIYFSSYFDFVRVRNWLCEQERGSVAELSEYSDVKQQRKALGEFTDLEKPILLVTERFYFFKRYFINLAEVMVFYGIPRTPFFYPHLVSKLNSATPNAFVMCIFTKYDAAELVRVVGTAKARQILSRDATVFTFVTA